jgi:hypothetical protein
VQTSARSIEDALDDARHGIIPLLSSSELAVQVAAKNVMEAIKMLRPAERMYIETRAGASRNVSPKVEAAPEMQPPEGTKIVTTLTEGLDGNSQKVTR